MKVKIILRIVVTVVILSLIFLGVWLIWFKPSNELEIFNNLTQLQSQDQDKFEPVFKEIADKKELKTKTGAKHLYKFIDCKSDNQATKALGQIKYLRAYMFGEFGSDISTTEVNTTYNPYFKINEDTLIKNGEEYVNIPNQIEIAKVNQAIGFHDLYLVIDDAFEYYYSYSQLVEKIERNDVKKLNGLMADLKSDYDSFKSNAKAFTDLESNLENFTQLTIINEVKALYVNMFNDYYDIIKSYNKLTLALKDFVNNYVFENNLTYDNKTVTYEMMLNSITELTSKKCDTTLENLLDNNLYTLAENVKTEKVNTPFLLYSYDAARVVMVFLHNAGVDGDSRLILNDGIVNAFAVINENYGEALSGEKSIFKLNRSEKYNLATSPTNENITELASKYNLTYLNQIQTILKFFYFNNLV